MIDSQTKFPLGNTGHPHPDAIVTPFFGIDYHKNRNTTLARVCGHSNVNLSDRAATEKVHAAMERGQIALPICGV